MRFSSRSARAAVAGIVALSAICVLAPAALARGPERIGATPAAKPMNLVLPLVADTAGLDRFATAVSTPGNPMYGQYKPVSWLSRTFGASTATRQRVLGFLRGHGATQVQMNGTGLFVDATMSAARSERMFRTRLSEFKTTQSGRTGRSVTRYTAPTAAVRIPKGLRGAITGVVGLDNAPTEQPSDLQPDQDTNTSGYGPVSGTPSGCAGATALGGFTPNQYLTAYGINTLQAAGLLGQGERVALVEVDGYQESDLDQFAACFGLHVPHIEPFSVEIPKPLAVSGETTLDLEVLMSVAPDLSDVDVYESDSFGNEFLLNLAQPLTAKGLTPNVISASIGECESTLQKAAGTAGIKAGESILAEATASGISVLASSGDTGSVDCNDPKSGEPTDQLATNYPASSPWITAVGGTNLHLNPDNTIAAEQVWNDQSDHMGPNHTVALGASGGGFSTLFPRPRYQDGTVTQNQRAVPDVSMLADPEPGYDIYCAAVPGCISHATDSPWLPIGGTSAATPLLAGGFALIDQYLREHGRQNLGLANPLLYKIGRNPTQAPTIFDDVTDGTNDVGPLLAGAAPLGCCDAAAGFDEGSGWGGVNVANLASVALGEVPAIVKISVAVKPKQDAVRKRGIAARVKCTAACRFQVVASVKVGKRRAFGAVSDDLKLKHGGRRQDATVVFAPKQLRFLQLALRHHFRVTARVVAEVLDSAGDPVRRSPTEKLAIKG